MLAIAPGCGLDVERGPDWLLVRVRNLDLAEPNMPPLAEVCGTCSNNTSHTECCWSSTRHWC